MILRQKARAGSVSESGFTLIEMLVTLLLVSILMTLGALALRQFWFVRSLEGGKDGMISTLRGIQQRVQSASNPLVYGARFTTGSSVWELVQYNRSTGTCVDINVSLNNLDPDQEFDAGVRVSGASFADYMEGAVNVSTRPSCIGGATDIAWFFARGSATQGSVTVTQPNLGRSETVCVTGLTGRVSEC